MMPEQAMEVVLVHGRDCVETESKVIVANQIVSMAEHNSKNSIDTLLLSLICSEFFNVANQKQSNITKGLMEQLGDYQNRTILILFNPANASKTAR
jgi:hypothetical protein